MKANGRRSNRAHETYLTHPKDKMELEKEGEEDFECIY